MSWRNEARAALRAYPKIKSKQAAFAPMITPIYGALAVKHGATRSTENAALTQTLTEREEAIIRAVDLAVGVQAGYYNADARMKVISLIYFKQTHTMWGAAIEVGYNLNTVKAWNTEVLMAVYAALKSSKKE